jgi:dCTP deaminase
LIRIGLAQAASREVDGCRNFRIIGVHPYNEVHHLRDLRLPLDQKGFVTPPRVCKRWAYVRRQQSAGGRQGKTLLIRNFDTGQLSGNEPNLSYELRVGPEYKDHRDGSKCPVTTEEPITLLPGAAVIIETAESLHMPKGMFGYIVPKVTWLQKGISNTLSKVDAGYNGRLLVTIFNLGKNKEDLHLHDTFCSLVIHSVGPGAHLYEKDEKRLVGPNRKRSRWQRFRNWLEANPATVHVALIAVTASLVIATITLAVVEIHLSHLLQQPHGH